MAAQIGDSTVPAESKKAALQVVRDLHARYASPGGNKPTQRTGPAPGTVENGYRFRGGNPADPKIWERM